MRRPGPSGRAARGGARGGFSLIELLLVVVLMGLAAGLAIPRFARSFQSARLRASVRTVVTAGRHAQALAVLRQTPAALVLDFGRREVEVLVVEPPAGGTPAAAAAAPADPPAGPASAPGGVSSEVRRPLAEGVRFTRFDGPTAALATGGVYWVQYLPSGLCDGFEVGLCDADGRESAVRVDRFSGRASVSP